MSKSSTDLVKPTLRQRWADRWNDFWFAPRDPTLLGAIRICCGLIVLYTLLAYSFSLQEFLGVQAWLDLDTRMADVRDRPLLVPNLKGDDIGYREPETEEEKAYHEAYKRKWGDLPPLPYPATAEEAKICDDFREYTRRKYRERVPQGNLSMDLRRFNIAIPKNDKQLAFVYKFWEEFGAPPAGYPSDANFAEGEAKAFDYVRRHGVDPARVYARGTPVWSIWFHVTDPVWMALIQGIFVFVALLFVAGFCARITSVITWLALMSYIHRNPMVLFGVDTMMNVLMIYLMIGPSGAALSLDRVIARWWSGARPRVLGRWRALWGQPAAAVAPLPPPPDKPVPTVSANVALRLLQVHVCIIYLMAGLSKLQGRTWWDGTAVWGTIANFEFAPMQYDLYNFCLRFLGKHRLVFEGVLTFGVYFTLFFEICYAFLVWRPATRWLMLGMAIVLHGFIGIFMGLKTFSLIMLVMNMAFLKTQEVNWALAWIGLKPAGTAATPAPSPSTAPAEPSTAIRQAVEKAPVKAGVKAKK